MKCPKCSTPLPAQARFCPNCGADTQAAPSGGGYYNISGSQGIAIGNHNKINVNNPGAGQPSAGAAPAKEPDIRILYLAANPPSQVQLRVDREARTIREKLRLSTQRERFAVEYLQAVRATDIIQGLTSFKPSIVHFSGHGDEDGSLILESDQGYPQAAPVEAIATLFKLARKKNPGLQCVLLNACYTRSLAQAIAQHVPYVIGMKDEVLDDAAQAFSEGFYIALGEDNDLPDAFEYGKVAIQLKSIPGHLIPDLVSGEGQPG